MARSASETESACPSCEAERAFPFLRFRKLEFLESGAIREPRDEAHGEPRGPEERVDEQWRRLSLIHI